MPKKSGITEATAIALIGSVGVGINQYLSDGAVADATVTTFVTALVPFVLRQIQKGREE